MATDNRFKKSIETATDNTQDKTENKINNASNNILENALDNIPSNTGNSILDGILKSSKKDRGKNYTIYLSADVGDALDKQAKDSEMSKSELVDKILRAVLLEKQKNCKVNFKKIGV